MSKIVFSRDGNPIIDIITLNPHGNEIALASRTGEIFVCDSDFSKVHQWKVCDTLISTLIFPSNGGLVSGSWNGSFTRWGLDPFCVVWSQDLNADDVWYAIELPDERIAVGFDTTFCILDMNTGQMIINIKAHVEEPQSMIFFNDLLVSGSQNGIIRTWTFTDNVSKRVGRFGSCINHIQSSPCGKTVAVGYDDGLSLLQFPGWTVVWTMRVPFAQIEYSGAVINTFTFSPDGRFIAFPLSGQVTILCATSGVTLWRWRHHSCHSVIFSHQSTKLFVVSEHGVSVTRLYGEQQQLASMVYGSKSAGLYKIWLRLKYRKEWP